MTLRCRFSASRSTTANYNVARQSEPHRLKIDHSVTSNGNPCSAAVAQIRGGEPLNVRLCWHKRRHSPGWIQVRLACKTMMSRSFNANDILVIVRDRSRRRLHDFKL